MTSLLDFVPVDMLDFRTNQLEGHNEKKKILRGTDYSNNLKEGEAVGNVRKVCRLQNITEQTFCRIAVRIAKKVLSVARLIKKWSNYLD